jgi:SAM-dependent methyltransferase
MNTIGSYRGLIFDLSITSSKSPVAPGGPALYVANRAGCRVTGIDANEAGVDTAIQSATDSNQADRVTFTVANANSPLPFDDDSFEAILCIDSMNHFPDRLNVFQEWRRILRPGRRAVFTDPVVITGPVTNDELALRSSIGLFLFVPIGVNEQLIEAAGLRLVKHEDVTANAATVSGRWHESRARHKDALIKIEGEERFAGLQQFFAAVHRLTTERRLSRIVYLVENRGWERRSRRSIRPIAFTPLQPEKFWRKEGALADKQRAGTAALEE